MSEAINKIVALIITNYPSSSDVEIITNSVYSLE